MKKNRGQWWENAVFYSLYVDKFTGNFAGLEAKLDYLERLGVTCVHVLPFFPSPMVDDGFDVSDYFGVRPELGTLEDFSKFVAAARRRGIDVMIDFVLNHTSVKHPWFLEASADKLSPKRDFYIWSETGGEFKGSVNAFPEIKNNVWIKNQRAGDYYFSTFYPEQADLNWRNPEVFSEMMKVIDFWANLGVRAFRLDAASHLIKKEGTGSKSLPETHEILKKIRKRVDSKYGDVALLAEVHDELQKTTAYFGVGEECQLVYHFSLAEELFLALIREDGARLKAMADKASFIPVGCRWLIFLRNHDDLSLATLSESDKEKLRDALDPERKFGFGNSEGISVRLANALKGDLIKIKSAFSLLFELSKNYPMRPVIYYGDEIGMRNIAIPSGEKDTRRVLRGQFDWQEAGHQMNDPSSLFSAVAKTATSAHLQKS